MEYVGSWQDMPQVVFSELSNDKQRRRQQAFSGRLTHETISD